MKKSFFLLFLLLGMSGCGGEFVIVTPARSQNWYRGYSRSRPLIYGYPSTSYNATTIYTSPNALYGPLPSQPLGSFRNSTGSDNCDNGNCPERVLKPATTRDALTQTPQIFTGR